MTRLSTHIIDCPCGTQWTYTRVMSVHPGHMPADMHVVCPNCWRPPEMPLEDSNEPLPAGTDSAMQRACV